VPDVLAAAAGAAAAETATWRDGARIPLMARMRRLAIAVTCRASFASSLSPVELARAERALRWSARTLQVRTPASVRLDRLKLDRRRRRMAFAELRALGRSLVANADTSRPTQLTATVHDLPSLASGLGQGHVEALLAELFTGAAGPLAQTAAWTLVRFGRECVPAQRLRAEWDAILPAGAAVEPQSLSRLPFTEAFVREVTRLHPTNDRITRQAVTETTLAGERVPPLTRVIVNVPALQRDPRSYDEPDRFLPERWLGARPNRHKLAYVAFGVGGRRCLGDTMALAALRALLPGLGRSWEIETGRMRLSSGSRRQPAESVRATVRAR
jgi:cytochrome P450